MKIILLLLIVFQLWQRQVGSKPTKPCGLAAHVHPPSNSTNKTQILAKLADAHQIKGGKKNNRRWMMDLLYGAKESYYGQITGPLPYGLMTRQGKSTATTTTRVLLDNDCDYINYYCMRGYYTGKLCAKTIYQTYDTFNNYCELEYVNCMEQYDMWSVAHMGRCYNISYFQTFAYYAYAVWDDAQLEEMYVMPNA